MHLLEELECGTSNTGIRTLLNHSQFRRLHVSNSCHSMFKAFDIANYLTYILFVMAFNTFIMSVCLTVSL